MSAPAGARDRNVVPAWRDSGRSQPTGELASLVSAARDADMSQLVEPSQAFLEFPGPSTALDLIATVELMGINSDLADQARDLRTSLVPTPTIAQSSDGGREVLDTGALEGVVRTRPRSLIRGLRRRLEVDPRDALAWVDMSLLYVTLGQFRPAVRAMEVALILQPEHRFVLRAASRLFVHLGDEERAFDLLDRTAIVRRDPWVAAAHLAASEVSGKRPASTRPALEMLIDATFSPAATAELASQLGTIELRHGRHRRGRELVRQSLRDPNDNVLSQATWASSLGADVPEFAQVRQTPLAFESTARLNAHELNWGSVIGDTKGWFADQPFSTQAPAFAGWAAGVMGSSYAEARSLIELSLVSNPRDVTLLNNKAFLDIHLGDFVAARNALSRIPPDSGEINQGTVRATTGLLSFRLGLPEMGRKLYGEAVRLLAAEPTGQFAEMASLYWALEETQFPMPDEVAIAVNATLGRNVSSSLPELRYLATRLRDRLDG